MDWLRNRLRQAKRIDELGEQVAALAEAHERLERTVAGVDDEWTEWYDKFRRLHAKLSKRELRGDEEPVQDAPGSTIDHRRGVEGRGALLARARALHANGRGI